MVRFALRFFGLLIMATAFAALIIDATRSISAKSLVVTQLGQTAASFAPVKFAALQEAVKTHAPPLLFDPILVNFLQLPIWLVIGAFGALLFWLAREPEPKIGYSSR